MGQPAARLARRTLSRQARTLPQHLALRQVSTLLQAMRLPPSLDGRQLEGLLYRVWELFGQEVWSVADVKRLGSLPAGASAARVGQQLAELADKRVDVGRFQVRRVDTGPRKNPDGRLWTLVRLW